jgi:hypothetical protein
MRVIDTGGRALLVGGDLARTVGIGPIESSGNVLELPIDVIDVSIDDGEHVACAHVVVRSDRRRGGWWFGGVVAVMNAEFFGSWDVAPRGHPNDGRVEIFESTGSMSVRERLAVRSRLPLGAHVPHPSIATRTVREASWDFEADKLVIVDGRPVGSTCSLRIRVRPDAAVVYI